ncbi:MAG: pathogenicity locus [bacterium]|nr:pathogenicity locus [bacterium]
MKNKPDKELLKEFRRIPGVGEKIAFQLWEIGIKSMEDLAGRDPEELYLRFCSIKGMEIDKCVLYVYRCAVYYASNEVHDPELLKWWNWKGRKLT